MNEDGSYKNVDDSQLKSGDVVLVEAGDEIPFDGEVIDGVAQISESAITGESVAVIKSIGDYSNRVRKGTLVLSNWLKIRKKSVCKEGFFKKLIGSL